MHWMAYPVAMTTVPLASRVAIGYPLGQAWPQPLFAMRGMLPIVALSERTCRAVPCPFVVLVTTALALRHSTHLPNSALGAVA